MAAPIPRPNSSPPGKAPRAHPQPALARFPSSSAPPRSVFPVDENGPCPAGKTNQAPATVSPRAWRRRPRVPATPAPGCRDSSSGAYQQPARGNGTCDLEVHVQSRSTGESLAVTNSPEPDEAKRPAPHGRQTNNSTRPARTRQPTTPLAQQHAEDGQQGHDVARASLIFVSRCNPNPVASASLFMGEFTLAP